MRSSKAIQIINAHAEGEVGDVIVGGVAPAPGPLVSLRRNSNLGKEGPVMSGRRPLGKGFVEIILSLC